MKTNLKTIALIFTIFTLTAYSQWTLCPGSGSITGLGFNPVISVADFNNIAVAGGTAGAPRVYLTTNSGNNFVNITGNLTGPELFAINIRSSSIIFVGDGGANGGTGGNAKVWKTTNMGVNWTVVLTTGGSAGFINGIRFSQSNNNTGIIVSDGPTGSGILVYKTTDGGSNWVSQNISTAYLTASIGSMFIENSQIYGFGAWGMNTVTFTTNGGTTWSSVNIPLTGTGVLVDCRFQNCSAVTQSSLPSVYIFQLNGSGTTINTGTAISNATSIRYPGSGVVHVSALTGTNPVLVSYNSGTIWYQMNTAGVNSISCMDSKYAGAVIWNAAVSSSGQVIKNYDILEGIIKTNELIPESFKLEQNYPNPFNPVTNINYSIPKHGFVTLKVYNSLGKLVSTLVNSEQTAGNYTVDFNAEDLSSGIYYYTIFTGGFTDTKKMLMVK